MTCQGKERGQIFVLATPNRPDQVDAGIRRLGRFDLAVWMGLPDARGRADIFEHYLRGLKLDPRLPPDRLAAELASAARDSRAPTSPICASAPPCFAASTPSVAQERRRMKSLSLSLFHFDTALQLLTAAHTAGATREHPRLPLAG